MNYCEIGIRKQRGVKVQKCSPNFLKTREYDAIRKTIFDIHLKDEKESPALAIMPVTEKSCAVSMLKYYPGDKVENRPHTGQNMFILEKEEFAKKVLSGLDAPGLDECFLNGVIDEFQGNMSNFWNELSDQKRWNLYMNLMGIISEDKKVALQVAEDADRRKIQADLYRMLPFGHALRFSSLTAGDCAQTEFHILFVCDKKKERPRYYELKEMEQLLQDAKDSYPCLKAIVTGPEASLKEFNRTCGGTLKSIEELEEEAITFLIEKGVIRHEER